MISSWLARCCTASRGAIPKGADQRLPNSVVAVLRAEVPTSMRGTNS